MKLATYNICHCENFEKWKEVNASTLNIARTAEVIAEINADIIGLNEVYTAGDREEFLVQEEKLAKLAGYPYYVFAQAKEYPWGTIGNAILSKYPILNVKKILVPAPIEAERNPDETEWYEDRVLLCVEVKIGECRLWVISSHFGLNPMEQRRIIADVCKEIDDCGTVVIMGDFNALPNSEFLAPLYDRLKSAAKEMGNNEFTFASFEPYQQIDYIFVPKTARVKEYTVYKNHVSDHYPISAEIEL